MGGALPMRRRILKLKSLPGKSILVLLKLQSEIITEDLALYPSLWICVEIDRKQILCVALQWPEICRMVKQ
jgi:hypothetical protein